jgi:type IV pilus assembly protein PilA
MRHKAFTLIELLVVVAIIGILAAVGVTTYNGIQNNAKESVTLKSLYTVEKFINTSLATCQLNGGGTLKLSPTRSINCDITNNTSNVNAMLDVFMNYFLDQGFKNAYNNSDPFINRTGGGGDNVLGRLRLDETECTSGSSKKKITLRARTHKETKLIIITPIGWC